MGAHGQLSRITSPISLVTHPLIPFPSAPGQLSLAQVHHARHLLGQLPRRQVAVLGDDEDKVAGFLGALEAAFGELGYPYEVVTGQALGQASDFVDVSDFGSGDALGQAVAGTFSKLTGRPAPVSVIRDALLPGSSR
jgi:hypothetical protein